jgi:hypothetical protein
MMYIKKFENFSNFISNNELLKHIPHYTFDDLVRDSTPEEVTDADLEFCDDQMADLLMDYNISFEGKKCIRFSNDRIKSCINYQIYKNEWWVIFYKYNDEYWLIETYFSELNWNFPGGSDYQYWLADSYDGIKEWTLKMRYNFSDNTNKLQK